ncbi:MAG: GNAT family N-acetyltransferase [Streptosporangiales bacterium]|nr:GNAT family N-acetyltransferase [Streptosporangiales bacterium]
MSDAEIRPLRPDDDVDAQIDLGERAFGAMPAAARDDVRAAIAGHVRDGRYLGAFDGGGAVASALYHDMRQWWHGRPVPMAGVASVKVAPECRGRGLGRRLMTELLDQIAERGYPVSALYPATMAIYRSLGWEVAGSRYKITVPSRELRSLTEPDPAAGGSPGDPGSPGGLAAAVRAVGIRRATPADAAEVIDVLGKAHESARHSGPLTRDPGTMRRWLEDRDRYCYLAPDGFLACWWNGPDEMHAERIVAASAVTYRALWSVLAGQSSTASVIRAKVAPDDPLRWLTREGDVRADHQWMWMLRVVDAPAAIAARGFPSSVSLSVPLVVADAARPSNSGRWRLEVAGGKGALAPDGDGAGGRPLTRSDGAGGRPLTLGARGLAALYGGVPLATLRHAGLGAGGSPETDAALDAAFPGPAFTLDEF